MTRRHSVSHAPTNTIAAALPRCRGLVHPHHTHDQPERDSEPNQTINKQRHASSSQQRSRAFLSVPERSRAPVRGQKRRCSRSFGRVRAPVEGGGLFSANVWRPNDLRTPTRTHPHKPPDSYHRRHHLGSKHGFTNPGTSPAGTRPGMSRNAAPQGPTTPRAEPSAPSPATAAGVLARVGSNGTKGLPCGSLPVAADHRRRSSSCL